VGFIHANMLPILKEHKQRPFSGQLLLLGQADIYFGSDKLMLMAKLAGVQLDLSIPDKLSHIPSFAQKKYLGGETLFRKIGFNKLHVLDYSGFEGADIIFDLNNANLPPSLENRFDAIIDHGTLEHVFHFPNAMNNIFRMLKVGGRSIISSPSGNFLDHGFYMFQPTLYLDFFTTNRWVINSIQIMQFTPDQETEPVFFADYHQGMFESVSYGKMDNKLYGTLSIATKTAESTGAEIPQQGVYSRTQKWATKTRY
jgi:hypothetical protein